MQSHTMELPRQIVVGEKNISEFGDFLHNLSKPKKVSLISGIHVKKILKEKIEKSLKSKKIQFVWHLSKDNQISSLNKIEKDVKKDHSDIVAGIGGGRSVDTAKMVSFNLDIPFVSVPTAASHDGMASPFVSVKTDKPHSIVASAPLGVFVDIDIIKKAPTRLLSSGCGDLIANIVGDKPYISHDRAKVVLKELTYLAAKAKGYKGDPSEIDDDKINQQLSMASSYTGVHEIGNQDDFVKSIVETTANPKNIRFDPTSPLAIMIKYVTSLSTTQEEVFEDRVRHEMRHKPVLDEE